MGKVTHSPKTDAEIAAGDEINPDTGLSVDAYLSFGSTPKAVPNPPHEGDVVTYLVKAECIGEAFKRRTDGEMRYSRAMSIISIWKPGENEPPSDDDQGELFDENCDIPDDDEPGGTIVDFPDQPGDEDTK